MLTVKEVADRIGRSTSTTRRLIDAGKIRAVNVGAGARYVSWSIPEEALVEFLRQGESDTINRIRTR